MFFTWIFHCATSGGSAKMFDKIHAPSSKFIVPLIPRYMHINFRPRRSQSSAMSYLQKAEFVNFLRTSHAFGKNVEKSRKP